MDITDVFLLVKSGRAFVTVDSAEEKQALMELCSKYWRPATGCNPTSWKHFPHLITTERFPTFSGKSADTLIVEGKRQYLFQELIAQSITIDTSDLL